MEAIGERLNQSSGLSGKPCNRYKTGNRLTPSGIITHERLFLCKAGL